LRDWVRKRFLLRLTMGVLALHCITVSLGHLNALIQVSSVTVVLFRASDALARRTT
jgi:hypothetical protein